MSEQHNRLSATFSPVSSTGVVLWLQPHQLAIVGAVVAWLVLNIFIGNNIFTLLNAFLVIIAALAAVTIKGRSLIQIMSVHLGFALRSATGQTRWTLNPLMRNHTVGYIDLPGAAGERLKPLEVINSEFTGASFILDQETGYATAVLRCMGKPFRFSSTDIQDERGRAFGNLLGQLAEYPDVVRITVQARSLMSVFSMHFDDDTNMFATSELNDMVKENMKNIMTHDMIVTLTVNPDKARDITKTYGGGIPGISGLLKDRLVPLVNMLDKAGIDQSSNIVWESTPQLRALMKLMSDKSAYRVINERLELDDDVPVSTNYREYTDYIHVGDIYARTLWIDKWPSDPAMVGFLSALTNSRSAQIIFTQSFKPLPENKARKNLNERKNELERVKRLNKNLGRNDDYRISLEDKEVDKRLGELAVNKAEVAFQGFVTIIASDKDELDTVTRNLMTTMTYMHFDRMHGQQYVGWISALPLGQAGR